MKNIFVSLVIFVSMTVCNFLLSILILHILNLPGGDFGMHPFLILINCLLTSFISFITVVIFKKNYHSNLRTTTLFQTIYIISLILSGFNPIGVSEINIFSLLIFINSFVVFLMMYLLHAWYAKKFNQKIS